MGARRNDITVSERAQMVIKVLNPERKAGMIPELAGDYGLSRQSIYKIAEKGEKVLLEYLKPAGHGPQPAAKMVEVNRNRLIRSSLVLTEVGVSQRDVEYCLGEILDTSITYGWVNRELARLEEAARTANKEWRPAVQEMLVGDEIYANGQPNLLVVGNESLYIYALSRQPDCEGETWGCLLLEVGVNGLFASDAGTGLAAGVKAAGLEAHQLDWDHLLRPLWGQVARLEKQAYAALDQLEARAAQFEAATRPKRLAHHLAQWEKLNQEAEEKMARLDAFERIARQVDACFALIDLQTGQLPQVTSHIKLLKTLGQQLQGWSGRIYDKLSTNLQNWADKLFSYQPFLAEALQPLQARYGSEAIAALSRLWQLEAQQKRRPASLFDQQQYQARGNQSLDEALTYLDETQLWTAWEHLSQLLGRAWRGSMLAECVNSLLRPILAARKHTDQGCLELFCFLHNVRPFQRGKRVGFSPAQLIGLNLPDDPFTLLGLDPKVSI